MPVAYERRAPNDAEAAALDKNHNHFILVDSAREIETHSAHGKEQAPWQAELDLRGRLEEVICTMEQGERRGDGEERGRGDGASKCLGESIIRQKSQRPSVYISMGGGIGTLETLYNCMTKNVPAVVIAGSGRVSTLLVEAWRYYYGTTHVREVAQHLKKAMQEHKEFMEEQRRAISDRAEVEAGARGEEGVSMPCAHILALVDEYIPEGAAAPPDATYPRKNIAKKNGMHGRLGKGRVGLARMVMCCLHEKDLMELYDRDEPDADLEFSILKALHTGRKRQAEKWVEEQTREYKEKWNSTRHKWRGGSTPLLGGRGLKAHLKQVTKHEDFANKFAELVFEEKHHDARKEELLRAKAHLDFDDLDKAITKWKNPKLIQHLVQDLVSDGITNIEQRHLNKHLEKSLINDSPQVFQTLLRCEAQLSQVDMETLYRTTVLPTVSTLLEGKWSSSGDDAVSRKVLLPDHAEDWEQFFNLKTAEDESKFRSFFPQCTAIDDKIHEKKFGTPRLIHSDQGFKHHKLDFAELTEQTKRNNAADFGYVWEILTRDSRDNHKSCFAKEFEFFLKKLEAEGKLHDGVTTKALIAYRALAKLELHSNTNITQSVMKSSHSFASRIPSPLPATQSPFHPRKGDGSSARTEENTPTKGEGDHNHKPSTSYVGRKVSTLSGIAAKAARTVHLGLYGTTDHEKDVRDYLHRLHELSSTPIFCFSNMKDDEGKRVYGGCIWGYDKEGKKLRHNLKFEQERMHKTSGSYLVHAFLQREFGSSFDLSNHESEVNFGDVFIWAIMLGRLEIAKICFKSLSRPFTGALLAAAICNKLVEDEELADEPQKVYLI
jgi:hypothetical protein